MSDRALRTRIPCGVCLQTVDDWATVDGEQLAVPCGHSEARILAEAATMVRVEFGQFADPGKVSY